MLGEAEDNLVFANRSLDWRITESPMFSPTGGDMNLVVSSRINLPSPSGRDLPIGNVCVLRSGPEAKPWTTRDSNLLSRFARRARSEILNAHERLHIQPRRVAQTEFVGSFIQRDLGASSAAFKARHSPEASTSATPISAPASPAPSPALSSHSLDALRDLHSPLGGAHEGGFLFDKPIARATEVVGASSVALLDLRELAKASAFKLDAISRGSARKQHNSSRTSLAEIAADASRPSSPAGAGPAPNPSTLKPIGVLGLSPNGCRDQFEDLLKQPEFLRPVQRALSVITSQGHNSSAVLAQAFSPVLPDSRQSTVVVPVFDHSGAPALVLIVTSDDRQAFDGGDRNFIERVGHLCLAALVKDQALASERAKLAFVAKISHELRAPMDGLAGKIGNIRDAYAGSASVEQAQKLEPMLRVADLCLSSLQSICDDSLVFAKLSNEVGAASEEDREAEVVDVAGLCSTVAKSVWVRKMKQTSVNQNEGQGDDVDAGTVEVILDFKPQQNGWLAKVNVSDLRRIIANVLTNAYTFTENGWVRLTMDTELKPDKDGRRSLEITVSDSGKGIPRSFLQSGDIWLPFRQADSFSRGSGLGLSIVRELLNRLGGAISITSEVGQGTTVVMSIPLEFEQGEAAGAEVQVLSDELSGVQQAAKAGVVGGVDDPPTKAYGRSPAHSRAPSPNPEAKEPATETDTGPPIRPAPTPTLTVRPPSSSNTLLASRPLQILVAEDNAVSRNILAKLFTKKGYKFHAVEDGQQAVDVFALRGNEFDIVSVGARSDLPGDARLLTSTLPLHYLFSLCSLALSHVQTLMDVQMPVKDGIEASFDIRKIEKANGWPRHRIVALSGLSNPEDLALALDNDGPMDAWLVKGRFLAYTLNVLLTR